MVMRIPMLFASTNELSVLQHGGFQMKYLLIALTFLTFMAALVPPEAEAFIRRGVVVRRPVARAVVVAPVRRHGCVWIYVNGVRVCR